MSRLKEALTIIPGALYFQRLSAPPVPVSGCCHWNPTEELTYIAYDRDFGPSHIAHLCQFCRLLSNMLQTGVVVIVHCSGVYETANCVLMLAAFLMMRLQRPPDEAAAIFEHLELPLFTDVAGREAHGLTLLDVLLSLAKARDLAFYHPVTFDWSSYNYLEKVENGNLNWIIPQRVLAFAGPATHGTAHNPHPVSFYLPLFRKMGVTTIIRLNEPKDYQREDWLNAGFAHHDMFFPDGTSPSDALLERFLKVVDSAPGAVAVHCAAGLGRTGTMIACYLIRQYKFTAVEAVAWVRMCRPGSVLSHQHAFCKARQDALLQRPAAGEPTTAPAVRVRQLRSRAILSP